MGFEDNARLYLADRDPNDRYASFDYCFNYFQAFREQGRVGELAAPAQLQTSCLQLGFYLASWGMLRGSTVLLTRSLRYLAPVVDAVVAAPAAIWAVDADNYGSRQRALIIEVADRLRRSVPGGMTDTLVTKIMLGVFGCIPAWDTNFKRGFRVSTFSAGALARVGDFYAQNAAAVDRWRVATLNFEDGEATSRRYTRAKVIDMAFFIAGV